MVATRFREYTSIAADDTNTRHCHQLRGRHLFTGGRVCSKCTSFWCLRHLKLYNPNLWNGPEESWECFACKKTCECSVCKAKKLEATSKKMKRSGQNRKQKKIWAVMALQEVVFRFKGPKQGQAEQCAQDLDIDGIVQAVKDLASLCEDIQLRYNEEQAESKKLRNELIDAKGNIRVFVRCRPPKEAESTVLDFDSAPNGELGVRTSISTLKKFTFDKVFTHNDDQADVFKQASPLITSVLDGYNVCILAYGQTGTGKTFTMEGTEGNRGVNYRSLEELFRIRNSRVNTYTYNISVSVLEVYNEKIRDLLSSANDLKVKLASEGGGLHCIPGLFEQEVEDTNAVLNLLQVASSNRAVASNNVNEHSSRSHSIVCITVKAKRLINGESTNSKLWLVDLAGSERAAKTCVEGPRLLEAGYINKSLSALGDVMNALGINQSHIPYRNSKLTQILEDSLGGTSRTIMMVQISPSVNDLTETVSSLNFATRVRGVQLGAAKKQIEASEGKKKVPGQGQPNSSASTLSKKTAQDQDEEDFVEVLGELLNKEEEEEEEAKKKKLSADIALNDKEEAVCKKEGTGAADEQQEEEAKKKRKRGRPLKGRDSAEAPPEPKEKKPHKTTEEEEEVEVKEEHEKRREEELKPLLVDVDDDDDEERKSPSMNDDDKIYYPSKDDPDSVEVSRGDLECLEPYRWLSSTIINFYTRYLQQQNMIQRNSHFFTTFFYTKLQKLLESDPNNQGDDEFLKSGRWWKYANLSQKSYIFVPIHERNHWSLAIICNPKKEDATGQLIILHMDSLQVHDSGSIFGNLERFIEEEPSYSSETRNQRPLIVHRAKVPRQTDGDDCGLFVLTMMERFLKEAPERLTEEDLSMFTEDWFPKQEASSLRLKIRNQLMSEFDKVKEDPVLKVPDLASASSSVPGQGQPNPSAAAVAASSTLSKKTAQDQDEEDSVSKFLEDLGKRLIKLLEMMEKQEQLCKVTEAVAGLASAAAAASSSSWSREREAYLKLKNEVNLYGSLMMQKQGGTDGASLPTPAGPFLSSLPCERQEEELTKVDAKLPDKQVDDDKEGEEEEDSLPAPQELKKKQEEQKKRRRKGGGGGEREKKKHK